MEIMKDKGAWVFENATIEGIKNKNINCITKFYFDNLKLIKNICGKIKFVNNVIYKTHLSIDLEDYMQQVFLDLQYYDFTTRKSLYRGIRRSCDLYNYGGFLASRNGVDECYFEDFANMDLKCDGGINVFFEEQESEIDKDKKEMLIINFLNNSIKNDKVRNEFFCRIFLNLSLKDIKGGEFNEFKLHKASAN